MKKIKAQTAVRTCLVAGAVGAAWLLHAQTPSPTPGGLRIGDVFTEPTPTYATPGPPRYDAAGPVLVIPNLASWKLPEATPTPQPTTVSLPDGVDLPRFSMLITQAKPDQRIMDGPGFVLRGRHEATSSPRHVTLRFETRFQYLRTEYRLIPSPEGETAGEKPIVILHAPGTTEQFDVPQGRWRLERRMWQADKPERVREEIYREELMAGRTMYVFTADPETEISIQQALSR